MNSQKILLNSCVIIGIIATILLMSNVAFASSSDFFRENGSVKYTKDRPATNPDFAPDESCDFDTYQLKCIPGSQQECPEDFGQNEDSTCVPRGDCPEGYHREDDDETGQCYPDSEGCSSDDFMLMEREDGNGMTCSSLGYVCDDEGHRERVYCIEYCNKNPDSFACRSEVN